MNRKIPRIGVGGPVGSGKTALIEQLVPRLIDQGYRPLVITNDIFTREDAEHARRTLAGILAPQRIRGGWKPGLAPTRRCGKIRPLTFSPWRSSSRSFPTQT